MLLWNAKRQYLLTCKVSRNCPLALHGRKHLFLYQIMSLPVPWDRNTIIQIIQRNVTGLHRKCLFICWRNQPPLMPHCHQRTQHIHADCIKDNTAQPADRQIIWARKNWGVNSYNPEIFMYKPWRTEGVFNLKSS